ncbi:MAG: branched-chain amino acid ABC transporter permease [Geminicoccaceae bacterium]
MVNLVPRFLLVLGLMVPLAACGRIDHAQMDLCERLIPALETEQNLSGLTVLSRESLDLHRTEIHYRPGPAEPAATLTCRFAGTGFSRDRLRLLAVSHSRLGPVSDVQLFLLRAFWLDRLETPLNQARPPHYLGQQTVNLLVPIAITGLLAAAYSLAFAAIGRIHLAIGEFLTLGGYTAFIGIAITSLGGLGPAPALLLAAALALGSTTAAGWIAHRLIFRAVADDGRTGQAPLIATVGLIILIQEALRLLQGASPRWVQPVSSFRLALPVGEDEIVVTGVQLAVAAIAFTLLAVLALLQKHHPLGRAQRAIEDDPAMAALTGVPVDRVIALTLSLSGLLAGLAGALVLIHYGVVDLLTGFHLGLKGLTAAVLGGLGSLPGAFLGAALLGTLDGLWQAYFPIAYRDVFVFSVLCLVLIFRPQGLLGVTGTHRRDV